MLYSEFIDGTRCRDNEHNYKVYKDLEILYMNSDLSKTDIYEYGKKLVNNEKSEAEIAAENQINAEISEYKTLIQHRKSDIDRLTLYLNECDLTLSETVMYKADIKRYKENIRHYKNMINSLKLILKA